MCEIIGFLIGLGILIMCLGTGVGALGWIISGLNEYQDHRRFCDEEKKPPRYSSFLDYLGQKADEYNKSKDEKK